MKHIEYYEIITKQLQRQFQEEKAAIEQAALYCCETVMKKRVIHVFGCGHSQMFAMEVFYRAGGLVGVDALLIPHLALFPKAKLSTIQERVEGFSNEYLQLEDVSKDDTMIIVSISGRNAGVIDMALEARNIGMKVIALTSLDFSNNVCSRHSSGKNLKDVVDVIIDIKCIKGDACLTMKGLQTKFCGTSTVLGMSVMESIIARTIELSVENGYIPPIYVSSNLDCGDAINAQYISDYHHMISCL